MRMRPFLTLCVGALPFMLPEAAQFAVFPAYPRDASARIAGTIKAGSAPRHMAHTGARRLIARLQRQALLRFKYGHRRPVFRLLHCKQPVPVRLYIGGIDQLRTHIPAAELLSIELQRCV